MSKTRTTETRAGVQASVTDRIIDDLAPPCARALNRGCGGCR